MERTRFHAGVIPARHRQRCACGVLLTEHRAMDDCAGDSTYPEMSRAEIEREVIGELLTELRDVELYDPSRSVRDLAAVCANLGRLCATLMDRVAVLEARHDRA